jgi:hypothetical protein
MPDICQQRLRDAHNGGYIAGHKAGLLAGLRRVERENLSLIGRASISTRHCAINKLITHVEATGELPEES